MKRSPIHRDLRSPKYRQRIKANAKRQLARLQRKNKNKITYLKGALEDIIWTIDKYEKDKNWPQK